MTPEQIAARMAIWLSVLCLIVNAALFGATVVMVQRAAIIQMEDTNG